MSLSAMQCWRACHVLIVGLLLVVATTRAEHSNGSHTPYSAPSQWDALWHFALNLVTYASLVVPAYCAIRWLRNAPHITHGTQVYSKLVRSCVLGLEAASPSLEEGAAYAGGGGGGVSAADMSRNARISRLQQLEDSVPPSVRLTICVLGLQVCYVTWGVLQERVMTRTYGGGDVAAGRGDVVVERFTNSQFLVLANRVLAFGVACVAVLVIPHPAHSTPLYKYSLCSISNILSSWCQYEALKFVSFPTQVVFKSCKVIPVMLMGKLVLRRTYGWYEYAIAALISLGVCIFLLADGGGSQAKKAGAATTFAGVIILTGYLTFDSFTSNWQKNLFEQYKVSSLQMMLGVNMFSCLFTLASLLQQGQLLPAFAFLQRHPEALRNIALLSVFSALGQLFIYYTVRAFGPHTLAIVMTTRQLVSIVTSCFLYGHVLARPAIAGAALAFGAVFAQAYLKTRVAAANGAGKKKQAAVEQVAGGREKMVIVA